MRMKSSVNPGNFLKKSGKGMNRVSNIEDIND